MSKIKKYIYPFVFSIVVVIFFITLDIVLLAVFDKGNYAGIAWGLISIVTLVLFIIPFYCVKYSTVVHKEKLKFLFATYNSLVLSLGYILPFCTERETYIYGGILFLWAEFWSVLPLVLRLIFRKKQDDTATEDTL